MNPSAPWRQAAAASGALVTLVFSYVLPARSANEPSPQMTELDCELTGDHGRRETGERLQATFYWGVDSLHLFPDGRAITVWHLQDGLTRFVQLGRYVARQGRVLVSAEHSLSPPKEYFLGEYGDVLFLIDEVQLAEFVGSGHCSVGSTRMWADSRVADVKISVGAAQFDPAVCALAVSPPIYAMVLVTHYRDDGSLEVRLSAGQRDRASVGQRFRRLCLSGCRGCAIRIEQVCDDYSVGVIEHSALWTHDELRITFAPGDWVCSGVAFFEGVPAGVNIYRKDE